VAETFLNGHHVCPIYRVGITYAGAIALAEIALLHIKVFDYLILFGYERFGPVNKFDSKYVLIEFKYLKFYDH
jgi:hypothetical protein